MPVTLSCKFCGNKFERDANKLGSAHFCCRECMYAYKRTQTDERYIGHKFGRLSVVRREVDKHTKYLCLCECGKYVTVRASALSSGDTVSCGCYRKENGVTCAELNGINEIIEMPFGSKFNRLTVIKRNGKKYGRPAYLCRCDCSNEVTCAGHQLRNGKVKSCGCLHREKSAKRLKKIATKHGLTKYKWYLSFLKHRRSKLDVNWTPEMEQFLRGLQGACVVCGSIDDLTVDHVKALSNGHGLEPGNACILCRSCNSAKHAKKVDELPDEWQFRIRKAAAEFSIAWKLYNTPSLIGA